MKTRTTVSVAPYMNTRDVVFVLGAGASYGDGAPLQSEIIKRLASDESVRSSPLGSEVWSFLTSEFALSGADFPTLESVFGYIDYILDHGESLPNYTVPRLRDVKQSLQTLVHHAVGTNAVKEPKIYRRFWEAIEQRSRNVGVVTTNYDCLADEAFDFLYSKGGLLDYCIPLMNYELYDSGAGEIGAFNWWINPRGPVTQWGDTQPFAIKLVKLHGSLNWKYCSSCGQVLLTAWNSRIPLDQRGFVFEISPEGRNPGSRREFKCPWDGSRFESLIVAPSHIKTTSHPVINQLRLEAAQELRAARLIVFVGYSFPDADVHLRALFKKNLRSECQIVVVNSTVDDALQRSYRGLGRPTQFIETTFDGLLGDKLTLDTIFRCG
jgi:NAD-dependent SIR2 family protein deacetylase